MASFSHPVGSLRPPKARQKVVPVRRSLQLTGLALSSTVVLFACGTPEVDRACRQYVRCQAAFDQAADVSPADVSAYAADGPCWGGDPRSADRCVVECLEATALLQAAADDAGLNVPQCDVSADNDAGDLGGAQ